MRRTIVVIAFLFFVFVLFYLFVQKEQHTSSPAQPEVTIRGKTFTVEIADSGEERAHGLSNRQSLAENAGMLFIFEKPGFYSFWMKDTLIPLDMIFINDSKIVTIHHNVQPQPNTPDAQLPTYAPLESINYVLEVSGGLSEKYGFREGDNVIYENLRY